MLAGGTEKLPDGGVDAYGDVPLRIGEDPRRLLDDALAELRPEEVVDLSDEPVLGYRLRHELAAIALHRGVTYTGADFTFRPPPRPHLCSSASLAIIGTGKRTGKTSVAGYIARAAAGQGRHPVIVAMGRGGPPEPEVLRGDQIELDPRSLLELADSGKHAASDYIEDALLARVPTVGCRRCGGGLPGAVWVSNVAEGIEAANELDGDLTILEGSGSSIPPSHADATCLVIPANIPEEYIAGYMGPYRLLLSDFVVVTMAEVPFGTSSAVSALTSRIRDSFRTTRDGEEPTRPRVVRTVFRPHPTRSVEGAAAYVATTAPEAAGDAIKKHLEKEHGCRVVGVSHSLSDRAKLRRELDEAGDAADVVLCEIKAAGVDVVTRRALEKGLEVVYMDNVPVPVDGDDLDGTIEWAIARADDRYERMQGRRG